MDEPASYPETKHCAYVYTGSITLAEMTQYVASLLENVQREIASRDSKYVSNCVAEINMPLLNAYEEQDLDKGYAFVWFSRQEVFHMLTGKNYNGNDITLFEAISPVEILKDSWNNSECIPVMTYKVPPFKRCVDDAGDTGDADDAQPSCSLRSDDIPMCFIPARTKRVSKDEYVEGKLFCLTILDPNKYTTEDILRIFSMFATDGFKVSVESNRKERMYIQFENVDDAYFAFCMRRKYKDPRTGTLLEFSYSVKPQPKPQSSYTQRAPYRPQDKSSYGNGNRGGGYKKRGQGRR